MRITPLDVRKQEFKKVVRGLDPEEVYAFLATVADEYETVLTDNRQLRDRVLELDEKVVEYRNMEKTLRDTLMTAERVMSEARDNARKEAELILRDAKVQAQQDSQNSATQAEALKHQLRELRSQRDAFLARLRGLAEAQIGMVDSFVKDFEEDDRHVDLAPARPAYDAAPVYETRTPEPAVAEPAPEPVPEPEAPAQHEPSAPSAPYPTQSNYHETPPTSGSSGYADRMPQADAPSIANLESSYVPASELAAPDPPFEVDSDGPTRGHAPAERVDQWRDYPAGSVEAGEAPTSGAVETLQAPVSGAVETPPAPVHEALPVASNTAEMPAEPSVDELANTVVEMANAAGAQSGHLEESVPSSPDSGDEAPAAPAAEQPEEEPAAVASAEESEESQEGSRWSISRFTRGLGDF